MGGGGGGGRGGRVGGEEGEEEEMGGYVGDMNVLFMPKHSPRGP